MFLKVVPMILGQVSHDNSLDYFISKCFFDFENLGLNTACISATLRCLRLSYLILGYSMQFPRLVSLLMPDIAMIQDDFRFHHLVHAENLAPAITEEGISVKCFLAPDL